MPPVESTRAATRWVTRIIPIILAAAFSYATYAVVAVLCVSFFLAPPTRNTGAAIAILVLYFLLLILTLASYARVILTISFDPGLVPLGPLAIERNRIEKSKPKAAKEAGGLESRAYYAGPDRNPDSPGLELFYTKDVFVCESDGRPKWCSECCNWKTDRVHHSSEIERCVLRMDHFCPWVGGMIGQNSFKFFVQFVCYTCALCGVVLGAAGFVLRHQILNNEELDPRVIAVIILAGFFCFFTFLMSTTSLRYVLLNMTNVDMLGATSKVYQLAVVVPRDARPPTTSALAYPTVTYPLPNLELGLNGEANGPSKHTPATFSDGSGSTDHTSRDALAVRTFAILKTEPGENPWHLGYWRNWKEVMGSNILDWFLPISKSPCISHESHESFYPFGPVLDDVCARYGVSNPIRRGHSGSEMRELLSREAGGQRTT
ncbi:palmitoyltransferase PFA5 [Microdochium trichocladiopsis]|uniref:Palmitoyltransferase n=1 Tax=Microdochium trichocladiopsis TaxID=1682393 RepID=A0A9P8Y498_9PEZI|nr:palmitoyltransferase PFA5 [Microdochium trichocladiopsis]KAH7029448.1 palmitoyltransferase PFA5 [Microdochium trichocladiopsis]